MNETHVLMEAGDKVCGDRIICQYRKERNAVLIRLTGGKPVDALRASSSWGMQRVIEGIPAEAIVDKVWRLRANVS